MSFIHLTIFIAAPPERVFDLARSVDVHKYSMTGYQEQIVKGTMTGLMELNDEVTWKAKHLFRERVLRVKITEIKRPDYFADEQLEGDFRMMKHEHYFKPAKNGTIMIDQFRFETKRGWIGKLFSQLYLEKYMTRLLTERNNVIKKIAESNQWKQYLEK
ncbi:MAG TPA: SRPBCC family protein [Flavisolibacter sp.]|nr:SRPBCC family protein [Flavisolibacter sp.]